MNTPPDGPAVEPLLKVKDVAEVLRLSHAQVYRMKERIGFIRLGGALRFEAKQLREYIERQRRAGPRVSPATPPGPAANRASVSPQLQAARERVARELGLARKGR